VKRAKAGETVPRLFEFDRLGHEINNVYSTLDLVYCAHGLVRWWDDSSVG
jgi:hypothetical protein